MRKASIVMICIVLSGCTVASDTKAQSLQYYPFCSTDDFEEDRGILIFDADSSVQKELEKGGDSIGRGSLGFTMGWADQALRCKWVLSDSDDELYADFGETMLQPNSRASTRSPSFMVEYVREDVIGLPLNLSVYGFLEQPTWCDTIPAAGGDPDFRDPMDVTVFGLGVSLFKFRSWPPSSDSGDEVSTTNKGGVSGGAGLAYRTVSGADDEFLGRYNILRTSRNYAYGAELFFAFTSNQVTAFTRLYLMDGKSGSDDEIVGLHGASVVMGVEIRGELWRLPI